MRDTYFIYRKKKDGGWLNVGKIHFNPMSGSLPFKVKYYPLIYTSKEKIEDKL